MKKTKVLGQCVGDVRLLPIDVGFDLLLHPDMELILPKSFASVGLLIDGEPHLLEGSRTELVSAIKGAGYSVLD